MNMLPVLFLHWRKEPVISSFLPVLNPMVQLVIHGSTTLVSDSHHVTFTTSLYSFPKCIDDNKWQEIITSGCIPIPRTYHSSSSMVPESQSIVVYSGGDTGTDPVADQKVYILNPSEFAFEMVIFILNSKYRILFSLWDWTIIRYSVCPDISPLVRFLLSGFYCSQIQINIYGVNYHH